MFNNMIKRLDYVFSILKTVLFKIFNIHITNVVCICMQFENIK